MFSRLSTHFWCLSLVLVSVLAAPTVSRAEDLGEEMPSASVTMSEFDAIKRFALEAGAGVNVILPFLNLRGTYRLPTLEDKLDVFVGFQPVVANYHIQQGLEAGARYYFMNTGWFQPYATASAGFHFSVMSSTIGDAANPQPGTVMGPGVRDFYLTGGLGADFMFNEAVGLNTQLLGTTLLGALRPEINLKLKF